ncbi:hypothetical protein HZS_157 [Henneguya salminicola]|nr:hypothetical protein HZS_157 [Henneguya salminicola]
MELESMLQLLGKVTRGNQVVNRCVIKSFMAAFLKHEFKNFHIKTNDIGKIISLNNEEEARRHFGFCKNYYILEVNKRLMAVHGFLCIIYLVNLLFFKDWVWKTLFISIGGLGGFPVDITLAIFYFTCYWKSISRLKLRDEGKFFTPFAINLWISFLPQGKTLGMGQHKIEESFLLSSKV